MKEQRHQKILSILKGREYITIAQLSQQLLVSGSTIRRDVEELDHAGLVVRSKNGVIPISELRTDTSVNFRAGVNAQSKIQLAKEAVRLIKTNSVIFLDSSSTVLKMAEYLRKSQGIVVVTNSLMVVSCLRGCRVQVYLIGGTMSERSHAFSGPLAEHALTEYNFDYGFFSPVAITPQGYTAETTVQAASIRKAALQRTKCRVLLCDQSKIGLHRAYNMGHVNDFDYIITDDTQHLQDTTATVRRV